MSGHGMPAAAPGPGYGHVDERARVNVSARYFLASIVLLVVLVAASTVTTARRTQAQLRAEQERTSRALADGLEAGSRSAIRANALVEEALARRLFDNARLVDELLRRPLDPADLERLARRNGLRRIDLLDLDGRPWTPPPPPWMRGGGPPAGMHGPPGDDATAERPRMRMRYMWGRRWAPPLAPDAGELPAPTAIADRRFWEGTVLGVAIGATSFAGIIAVHADATELVEFRRDVGVDRQLAELAARAGVAAVALSGPDRVVLASTSPGGTPPTGAGRLEVARPFALAGGSPGLLTVTFSTEPMERAWRQDVRAGLGLGAAVLAVGAVGLGLIFWVQQRHLRERARLEAELARGERLAALGDVAAAFAHEVRNPLNAVSMGLQRLRAEFAPAPVDEYARFVDLMQGEVARLNAIVEEFLTLARPLPLAPAPVAVGPLVEELAALVEGQARAASITLRVAVPAPAPTVVADRDHLKQVLLNLVLNAVQATGPGGVVTLEAQAARDGVALVVADTGPGIPPDALPRIFDPYFTTKAGGLGLGLTIARRIVEAHGGTLEAESVPGQGARFRVRLPAVAR
jgi:signal transduction histidine kinase